MVIFSIDYFASQGITHTAELSDAFDGFHSLPRGYSSQSREFRITYGKQHGIH
jgi:hypothetical protein